MRIVGSKATSNFFDSALGSYLVISIASLIAAVVCFVLVGSGAQISGKQGGLAFQAGGALAGFLIVLIVSYEVVRRLRQDSAASMRRSVADLESKLERQREQLQADLQHERESHAQRLSDLANRAADAEEVLRSYRRRVKEVLIEPRLRRSQVRMGETYKVWLWIGSDDEGDRVVEEHETQADEGTILWHTVRASALGEGTPRSTSLRRSRLRSRRRQGAGIWSP